MPIQFVLATHRISGRESALHHLGHLLPLFNELREIEHGDFSPSHWNFALLDSSGEVIEADWDWRDESVTISLGELFSPAYGTPAEERDPIREDDRVVIARGAIGSEETAADIADAIARLGNTWTVTC